MIYVVRHGETELNKERRLQGREGLPLNEKGIQQAIDIKEDLEAVSFDLVFSSTQERAIQTAEIISGKKAIIDSRLDVFDLGSADRLKREEVKLRGSIPDPSVYESVEEIHSFVDRIFHFMYQLEAQYKEKEKNILIAGHRCTTGCFGAYFKGIPEDKNILRYSSNNGEYKTYSFRRS